MKISLFVPALMLSMQACVATADSKLSAPSSSTKISATGKNACAIAMQSVGTSNYATLRQGSQACNEAGDLVAKNFLILASRIRFRTDSELLLAKSNRDEKKRSKIENVLYVTAYTYGSTVAYREPRNVAVMLSRLATWKPTVYHGYNPGWNYTRLPQEIDFNETYARHRANLVARLNYFIALVGNDEFFKNFLQIEEIQASHVKRGGLSTEKFKVRIDVNRKMTGIIDRLSLEKPKYNLPPKARINPDANFRQIFAGVNGPKKRGYKMFFARQEAQVSWLGYTLKRAELANLLRKVDFDTQFLIAVSAGQVKRGTGSAILTDLSLGKKRYQPSYTLGIGVMPPNCSAPTALLFPFAVAVAPLPNKNTKRVYRGKREFGFYDGCD